MTLTSSLDQTFSPIVDEISTLLTTCEVKKDSASTKLDEIATSLSEISTYIGQIPAAL